jgi:hypothetical protein
MKKIAIIFITLLGLMTTRISALNPVTGEIEGKSPEEVNKIVIGTLDKIQSKYKVSENTKGFTYKYTSPVMNLYPFEIFIGEYGKNSTLLRVESIDGTSQALLDTFTVAATGIKYPYSYEPKNLVLSHALTFVLPAAGNFYTNQGSLLDMKHSWLLSILYLGIDGALLWMGGTTFFTHDFDPFGDGLAATLALMGTYRLGHMFFNHFSIVAHNNLVGLGYTYQFK